MSELSQTVCVPDEVSPTEPDRNYDALLLSNQLCFPFYVCAKEIVRRYKPYLDKLDLTYTQYITLMALWEHHSLTSKDLGHMLYLDSGTLTPVLKKLEQKGILTRQRDPSDERNLIVTLTQEGEDLKKSAVEVPYQMAGCLPLTQEEGMQVGQALQIMLRVLDEHSI